MLHAVVIIIVGLAAYSNTFHNSFHFDDIPSIVENADMRNIRDLRTVFGYESRRAFGMFTFALNYHVNGLDVVGYHVVNVAVHLGASLCAWWLTLLLLTTPVMRLDPISGHRRAIAFAVGFLFVAHPVQIQAVTYIVQRLASLATMFYLASLCLFVKGRLTERTWVRVVCFSVSAAAALLGMFTKEIVFTLPLAILLVEVAFFQTGGIRGLTRNRALRVILPMVVIFLFVIPCFMLLRYHGRLMSVLFRAIPSQRPGDPPLTSWVYLFTQFRVVLTYIRLVFLPVGQNLDHDFPASRSFFEPFSTAVSFVVLAAVLGWGIWMLFRKRAVGFGVLWFFLTLSVESSFKPIRNVIFEHRLYLPMFGAGFAAATSVYYWLWGKHTRIAMAVFLAAAVTLPVLTWRRNAVWKDEITLNTDIIAKSPHKARAYLNRGGEYLRRGDLSRALADIEKGLSLDPDNPEGLNNYAIVLYKLGRRDEALVYFERSVERSPRDLKPRYNYGNALMEMGSFREAFEQYEYLVTYVAKTDPDAYALAGKAAARMGDYDTAMKRLNRALELDPDNEDACFYLGNIMQERGELLAAVEYFRKSLQANPGKVEAYTNCGATLYMLGRVDEAIDLLRRAVVINPNYTDAHNTLGLILYEQGELNEAAEQFVMVLRRQPGHQTASKYLALIEQKRKEAAVQ